MNYYKSLHYIGNDLLFFLSLNYINGNAFVRF